MLPTLKIKGKLAYVEGSKDTQEHLNKFIPVDYIINKIKNMSSGTGVQNRVIVLKSETASGKSTVFPAELYNSMLRGRINEPGIVCTQPRVITAIENVKSILRFYGSSLRLGENIGWSTKYNKLRSKRHGLLSVTIGTLNQQLRSSTDEEISKQYRYILIDETHERDIQTDMTLAMLKNLLVRNQTKTTCPFVVLMSATFDPYKFLSFFDCGVDNFVWCRGETAGFDQMWEWNENRIVNDICRTASTIVGKIIDENPNDPSERGDILIFLPGKSEFRKTEKYLVELNKTLAPKGHAFSLLTLDSEVVQEQSAQYSWIVNVPVENQLVRIDGVSYIPRRRVILSTNVAETGLTLQNLKYVVDSGLNREVEYNPVYNVRGLITKPATKSRIEQRRGRAGRLFRGVFYPMYPAHLFEKLQQNQFPQIQIEDISICMLDIVVEQLKLKRNSNEVLEFDINAMDMVDPPSPDSLLSAMEKMYTLGMISFNAPKWNGDFSELMLEDAAGLFSLTKLGACAHKIGCGLSMESLKMILSTWYWGASTLDAITSVAWNQLDDKSLEKTSSDLDWGLVYKTSLWQNDQKAFYFFGEEFMDGIVFYNALKKVISGKTPVECRSSLIDWCAKVNISYRTVLSFIKIRDEIIEKMISENFKIFSNEENSISNSSLENVANNIVRLKYCIYEGYKNNMMVYNGSHYTFKDLKVELPTVFREWDQLGLTIPKYILFEELKLAYLNGIYHVNAKCVSVCAGFINIDIHFSQI